MEGPNQRVDNVGGGNYNYGELQMTAVNVAGDFTYNAGSGG